MGFLFFTMHVKGKERERVGNYVERRSQRESKIVCLGFYEVLHLCKRGIKVIGWGLSCLGL